MRLFRRQQPAEDGRLTTRMLPGGLRVEVVGESNYQDELERLAGGRSEESANVKVLAALVPEPSNPYDPNAVAVMVDGKLVGYLPRPAAVAFQPVVKQLTERGEIGICKAIITGGWYRSRDDWGHFGIYLDLAPPEKLL